MKQLQRSKMEVRELDEAGTLIRSSCFETTQRWVYRFELELLFAQASYSRGEIFGDFKRGPLDRDDGQMMAFGWID